MRQIVAQAMDSFDTETDRQIVKRSYKQLIYERNETSQSDLIAFLMNHGVQAKSF